jgi:malate dehydrogenase (oxaloacetate-decarboxylating)(NADP+)
MLLFPTDAGLGLGALVCGATRIDDEDLYTAAKTLANQVTPERQEAGCVYPPLSNIREVSLQIAVRFCETAYARGTASVMPPPDDMGSACRAIMYTPSYE